MLPDATTLRARVPGFVRAQFLWPGTLRLHAAAMGADVLRAPLNILLAPVLVLVRALGWLARRLGWMRLAVWLASRRVLLRTAVAAQVEAAVLRDLLGMAAMPGQDTAAVFAGLPAPAPARIARLITDYAATRSAVGEITTALATVLLGAALFHALTPGLVSFAPGLAQSVAETRAIAEFPLGQGVGGLWYGVFPVGASPGLVAVVLVALVMGGAVFTAFAGVLADPVQVWTGLHRRRLLRLIDSIDAARQGLDHKFTTREHLFARVFDLLDSALSIVRLWRG
jgi:hypothetical protein